MAICSHQDTERREVSSTAFYVAYMRHVESSRADSLIKDPYAGHLAGDYMNARKEAKESETSSTSDTDTSLSKFDREAMIDCIAVRSKYIDDALVKAIVTDQMSQICVLGAGLDTRPWRVCCDGVEPSTVHYFEVDFPEVFEFKLSKLASVDAVSGFNYHAVVADLSVKGWEQLLIAAGFDVTKPTFWIMEGLTGYLTEEELHDLFHIVSDVLSAGGSSLVATFITPTSESMGYTLSLHRYKPENPLAIVDQYGWSGEQREIKDIADTFNRGSRADYLRGYKIVAAKKRFKETV